MSAKIKKSMTEGESVTALPSAAYNQTPSSSPLSSNLQTLSAKKAESAIAPSNPLHAIAETYFKKLESLPIPFSILKEGLSEIGDSPDKLRPVYRKLSLPRKRIRDISFLSELPYLFNLDLQGNIISDISAISSLTYLVQLNLSNNNLREDLWLKVPPNLQDINLANNKLSSLKSLGAPRFLTRLCIDYNHIDDLEPISTCRYLRELHLDGNSVTTLAPVKDLPLKIIRAKNNDLLSLEGVRDMHDLQELYVDNNNIESLYPLENHPNLGTLSISDNSISELEDIAILSSLKFLRYLWIGNNPVIDNSKDTWNPDLIFPLHENAYYEPSFNLYTVFLLPKLVTLDGIPVSPEKKVASVNTYNPSTQVSSSIQHVNHLKVQAKNYVGIKAEDLLRAKRLCPIVICGPSGAGKRTLTRRLLQEFPHIYGLCVSHTTRKPRMGEENGVHYYFVSKQEMNRMNASGKFVEYVNLFGNDYGTSMDSIDHVTEQGKVCLLDLEFEGVVALKKSMLKPKYILIKTPTLDVLKERLAQRHNMKITDPELAPWVQKAREGHYNVADYDLVIVNDDLDHAYKQLKDYCLSEYWKAFEDEED